MQCENSLEPSDLLASLLKQKPSRDLHPEQQLPYGRTLHFSNEDDARQALKNIGRFIPEEKSASIEVNPTTNLENGKLEYSLHVPNDLIPVFKRNVGALSRKSAQTRPRNEGLVDSLASRSAMGNGPRQMPDDPLHPERSVNNFMAPLGGLERVFDLCERLDYARGHHSGNKHKYYASSGSYGMRFDTKEDAENAKKIFGAVIHDGEAMMVDEQVVNHKPHFWLKVPGDMASTILLEANTLSLMREHISQAFEAGNMQQATQEREALLDLVTQMGLGNTHLAEQMARDALSGAKVTTRS